MTNAIEVHNLSKQFRIYANRPRSLKEGAVSRGRKRYDEFWALRDVSFDIEAGTAFGFIGHNGSGKSTMLRCITGIYKPTSGHVNVSGRISALLELGSGFHPDLSGRENIYLNASILGLSKREIDAVIDDIIEFSGVEQFIDSPVKVYSSGMYVRLGFAVAVHVNPEILIIDEVVAVGDEEFQRRCFEHIYKLRAQGVTIVLVSHSLGLVQTMCDRAAWFDHGRVRSLGSSVEVVGDYLKSVNAEEVKRSHDELETSGEAVAVDGGTRRGSGEIRFRDVALLDSDGNRTMFGQSEESLTVRASYTVNEPIVDPVFAVSIRHENGLLLSLTSTSADGLSTGRVDESGEVELRIPRLGILSGDYYVSVYAIDKHQQHVYDEVDRAFPFHVRTEGRPGRDGLIDLQPTWAFSTIVPTKEA
ncbi:MAG: ABC transporter ATP-binding protein [Microthrixaceae bacterium]|nr:ABC transporter ATP-binding protein [Microthrixaceae bacterium]